MPRTETTYSDEELGLSPGWDEQLDPNIRRELREGRIVRSELRAATEELGAFRRTQALATAGIPQDAKGLAFAKVYAGSDDPTEARTEYEKLFGRLEVKPGG